MGSKKIVTRRFDFLGAMAPPLVASRQGIWCSAITGAAPPTVTAVLGEMKLALTADAQVQNACLYFGDILSFDIDDLVEVNFWARLATALGDQATTMAAFGLASARNDAIDTLAQQALFRVLGNTSAVLCETDDAVADNDDKDAATSLLTVRKHFQINFADGTSDVKFYADNAQGHLRRVCKTTTFSMAGYTGGLQLYAQIQKAANANLGALAIEAIEVKYRQGA